MTEGKEGEFTCSPEGIHAMFARLEEVERQIRMQGRVYHWKNKTMQINILRLKQIVDVLYKETLPHTVALRYVGTSEHWGTTSGLWHAIKGEQYLILLNHLQKLVLSTKTHNRDTQII